MPSTLSIVIPTYNSINYIKDTLTSLENQINKDFEVIIADDRSTDESYLRLLEYSAGANFDMRVYQCDQNGGPGKARNFGLSKAIGRYIVFVDSDDRVSEDFTDEIIKTINENDEPDCIIFDYNSVKDGKISHVSSFPLKKEEGFEEIGKALVFSSAGVWGKAYKKQVIDENGITFPPLFRQEDFCFAKKTISCCKNVYVLKKPLYYYNIRQNSVMSNKKLTDYRNSVHAFQNVKEFVKDRFPEEIDAFFALLCIYSAVLSLCETGGKSREIKSYIKQRFEEKPDVLKNEYVEKFPKHQRIVLRACKNKNILLLKILAKIRSRR